MGIDWTTLLRKPQTYGLLVGTGLGYALLLVLAGSRPLAWLGGGGIAVVMAGSWVTGFRQPPQEAVLADDLLDTTAFNQQLQQLAQGVPNQADATWQQVSTWATESQTFAARICAHDPLLRADLLEAMHTVTDLAGQVAVALKVMGNIQTPTYQQVAQQRLQASCDRMAETHTQLQQLQDQIMLSALDESVGSLPQRLQTLVAANKQILQADYTENA